MTKFPRALAMLALSAVPSPGGLTAQSSQSSAVFDRHAGSVFKVEILENRSSTPSIVGTAFVVEPDGVLLTNYHVVMNLVFRPRDYRVRLVDTQGALVEDVDILRVDAANDLAVLRAPVGDAPPLAFAPEVPQVGAQVFSLGFPRDLSGTVVEGSFGGPMQNTLSGTFHFTGSLNPGMSGGPTLLPDGTVVGVNVATSGNQLSYLVPAARALDLIGAPREDEPDLVDQVRAAAEGVQDRLRALVLDPGLEPTEIGGFSLPRPRGDLMDCSADPIETGDFEYDGVLYRCELDDLIWLDPDDGSALLSVEHIVLSSDVLLPTQFGTLYTEWFGAVYPNEAPESDWATEFRCGRSQVTNAVGTKLRVVQCWRRRPELEGLYDLFVRTATLGGGREGVVSTYVMGGATSENARDLVRQALGLTGRAP